MIQLYKKIILCFAFMILAVMPVVSQETTTPNTYKITVLLFSGLPNPTYTIEKPAEVEELTSALADTTIPKADQKYLSQSGYIGLKVEGFSGKNKVSEVIIPSKPAEIQTAQLTKSSSNSNKIKSLEEKILQYGKQSKDKP